MNNKYVLTLIAICLTLLPLGLCVFGFYYIVVYAVPPETHSALYAVQEQTIMPFEFDYQYVPWIIGIVIAGIILWAIVKNGYGAILVFGTLALVVIGVIFWTLLYRGQDVSTPEARDRNLQTIQVVQPIGGDPNLDDAYAGINRENAGTNVINAGMVSIYTVLIWVTVIIFFGFGIFLWYVTHK